MKTILKIVGGLVVVVVGAAVGVYIWASSAAASRLAQTYEVPATDFPVPFPLTAGEIEALHAERKVAASEAAPDGKAAQGEGPEPSGAPLEGIDLEGLALERAVARGKHLVMARYSCVECHGENFGGGVMVDDPAIGTLLGPNITAGKGGKVAGYSVADWSQVVRHGVAPDGHPLVMPSEDYQMMSDQELSDIIAYIASLPTVDNEVAPIALGPLGTLLLAAGQLPLSADTIADHNKRHAKYPPEEAVSEEFGKHLSGICIGCHRAGFEGGPIAAGPPDWAPATNLTPHETGLKGWSYDDFAAAMTAGVRPDGTKLKMPMTLIAPYAQRMREVELKALWMYLQSLPPQPTGI